MFRLQFCISGDADDMLWQSVYIGRLHTKQGTSYLHVGICGSFRWVIVAPNRNSLLMSIPRETVEFAMAMCEITHQKAESNPVHQFSMDGIIGRSWLQTWLGMCASAGLIHSEIIQAIMPILTHQRIIQALLRIHNYSNIHNSSMLQ
jgi:hypothetical protein